MNQQVADFMKQIMEQIKYKKIRLFIEYELYDHIEMLKDGYVKNGLNEEEAYNKALLQMGDAQKIGNELNETHKPHIEWSTIILTLFLLITGFCVTVFIKEFIGENYYHINLFAKFAYIFISILVFIFSYFLDYNALKKYSLLMYLFSTVLMIFTLLFAHSLNGRKTFLWIPIFGYTNVIPIVTFFWLLSCVELFQKFLNKKNNLFSLLILLLITIMPVTFLRYHSTYYTLILIVGFFSIGFFYIYKNYNIKNKIKIAICLCVMSFPTIYQIIKYKFVDLTFSTTTDYVYVKPLIETSKLFGSSNLANSVQDEILQYISSSFRFNFSLTFIIIQFGFIIGILLIIIIVLIMIRMFKISLNIKQEYGKALSISILTIFFMKFIINIFMNLGLLPILDSYMPFVSNGGVLMTIDMAMLGIFLGIYHRKDILLPN